MAFNIANFKANFKGGARSSLFQVQLSNPVNLSADLQIPFMCRAADLPEVSNQEIPVYHFGRAVKFAGNRDIGPWSITVYNDEDFRIRNAMEEWSNAMNGFETNVSNFATGDPNLYKTAATVTQFSKTGLALRTYKFIGIFPTSISAIPLDWGDERVEEFTVTFAVDYFYVESSITGDVAGGV